jgi:hypothetical protein
VFAVTIPVAPAFGIPGAGAAAPMVKTIGVCGKSSRRFLRRKSSGGFVIVELCTGSEPVVRA